MKTEEFKFAENSNVRVIPFFKNEANWFVAVDICNILEISNVTKALDKLDEDEKQVLKIEHKGQTRDLNVISESGLYALVLSSQKPEARVFRKWVTSEVLPAIRKAGKYTTEMEKAKQLALQTIAREIQDVENQIESLRRQAKELVIVKDQKQLALRTLINSNDTQMTIELDI